MKPCSEYFEWPATQRMRPDRLARSVEIFQHQAVGYLNITGYQMPLPKKGANAALPINFPDYVVDAEKFS